MNLNDLKKFLVEFEKRPRICSILYDGRSGSVFLQSLLDDHPDVSTFPATALMGGARGRHINEMLAMVAESSWEQLGEEFVRRYPVVFDSSDDTTNCRLNELGSEKNEKILVDQQRFLSAWLGLTRELPRTARMFFIAIHIAYEVAKQRPINNNLLIVHAMHTPEPNMEAICKTFPEQKIILMTREPLDTFNSHYKSHINVFHAENPGKNFWDLEQSINYPLDIFMNIFTSYKNIKNYVANHDLIRALKLEDIHANAERTMSRVAEWLEIPYHKNLHSSSFGGKTHWGDISIHHRTGPANKKMSYEHSKDYFENDAKILFTLTKQRYLNYEYPKPFAQELSHREFLECVKTPSAWECELICARQKCSTQEALRYILNMQNISWVERILKRKTKANLLERVIQQRATFAIKIFNNKHEEINIKVI